LFSCLAASALLAVCGCGTTSTSTTTTTTTSGATGGTSKDWKADFLRQRSDAEKNVCLAKIKFKPGSEELIESQFRYQRAKTCVNLLLEGIQHSIRNGENPMAAPYYASRADEASETLNNFNMYVVRKTTPPGADQPKFLPLLLPLVAPMVNVVVDRVSAANKQRAEERKATYERVASDLNSVRFAEFADIRP